MFNRFTRFKQIHDLDQNQRITAAHNREIFKRALVPIAVIDDEQFVAQQTLTNNRYDIRALGDIKNISEISKFNIILCDLQGVGIQLNDKSQGAYIIEEIKRNHPEKIVIAYTGGAVDNDITVRANKASDYFIKKDASVEEWIQKLDNAIDDITNPIRVWHRQRLALISYDVSTLDILKLEDAFVKSVQTSNERFFMDLTNNGIVKDDARSIAQSLIASGIFAILAA